MVEPAIALSIIYVGADNLLGRGGRDVRAWIAFAFGFVHGFGFADVLREMGLPQAALGWSLFAFNLGVELGSGADRGGRRVGAGATAIAEPSRRRAGRGRRLVVW